MAFDSSFPAELDQIISRAIAKDPTQRYQSGMEMASDVQRLRARLGSSEPDIHAAGRLKQRAVTDLSKPKHRLTPYFAKAAKAVWPLRLAWAHVLTVALLAAAVGFFFSHLREIRPQSAQALDLEPTIATNKKEVAAPAERPTAKLNIEITINSLRRVLQYGWHY